MIQEAVRSATEGRMPRVKTGREVKLEKLGEVARSFEAVFLQMLMKSMRATVKKSGLLGAGRAEGMFTSLLDLHIAERGVEKSGAAGLGIAKAILDRYGKRLREEGTRVDRKG